MGPIFDSPLNLALGFWLPLLVFGILIIRYRYTEQRYKLQREERIQREEIFLRERELSIKQGDIPNEFREFITTYFSNALPDLFERHVSRYMHDLQTFIYRAQDLLDRPLLHRDPSELDGTLLKKLDEISARLDTAQPQSKPAIVMASASEHQVDSPNRQLIREISHALNTPIS